MSKREGYQKSGRVWSFAIHEGPKSLEKDGEYQRRLLRKKSGKILVFYQTPSAPPKRSYMVVCTWAANFPSQYVKINFVGAYWESSIKWILDKALTLWCIAMYWIDNSEIKAENKRWISMILTFLVFHCKVILYFWKHIFQNRFVFENVFFKNVFTRCIIIVTHSFIFPNNLPPDYNSSLRRFLWCESQR